MKKISKIFSRRLGRGAGGGGEASDEHWEPGPVELAPDIHQLTPRRWCFGGAVNGDEAVAASYNSGSAVVLGSGSGRRRGRRRRRRRRIPKTGASCVVADGSEGTGRPCVACARIDFARLLEWQPGDARPWVSLSHALKLADGDDDDEDEDEDDEDDAALGGSGGRGNGQIGGRSPSSRSPSTAAAAALCPWCVFFHAMIIAAPDDDDGDGKANNKAWKTTGKFTPYLRIRLAFERLGGGEKHGLSRSVLFEVTTRNRSLPWGYIIKAAPLRDDDDAGLAGYFGGDAPTAAIQGRAVPPLLHLALSKRWVDFCREKHATKPCGVRAGPPIPGLRLVDCEDRRVVSADHLRSAGEHQNGDAGVDYVTLSYVWGDQEPYGSGIGGGIGSSNLPGTLPQLIADAVTVTKALGFRYLWVDRYCIPSRRDAAKDAAAASERRRQLGLMGQIYARSELTLIVAAGEGVHDGIPGVSTPREEQLSLKTATGLFTTSLLRPDLDVASSRWASRAWTYQEGLLSRRRLVFTQSQVYFQCQTLHCHESVSLPLHLAPGLNLGRVFPPAGETFQPGRLKSHIKAFMAKAITHGEDRLDAFRGILHECARREGRPAEHFLGLPLFHPDGFANVGVVSQTDRLAVALGWMPDRTVPAPSRGGDLGSRAAAAAVVVDPYCLLDEPRPFPSWTWLAWRPRQAAYNAPSHTFNFSLVGETPLPPPSSSSLVVDGVSATPRMEVSVGFGDGMVLSWEIDGDAIARRAGEERVEFLRLKTLCFDLVARRRRAGASLVLDEPGASALGEAAVDAIGVWVRRCGAAAVVSAAASDGDGDGDGVDDDAPADQEYQLTGILISGRNWKPESGSGSQPATATILVCGRRNWDPQAPLVRLGILSMTYGGLVAAADEIDGSIMKSVDSGAGEKKDLRVRLRELDIY